MNGVFFFFLHEVLSGRRRVAATLAFQQIPILRQQEKNERGLPAAFHQKPNRHEVQSQEDEQEANKQSPGPSAPVGVTVDHKS